MPNYGFNEIGTFEQADFMNRVYVGKTEVTDNPADAYPVGARLVHYVMI